MSNFIILNEYDLFHFAVNIIFYKDLDGEQDELTYKIFTFNSSNLFIIVNYITSSLPIVIKVKERNNFTIIKKIRF